MQVVVDSLLTHYARTGKGKTIVFLHGWADSSASFQALAGSLAPNHEVITLDLPGFGGTARPPQPWGLQEYVDFVAHFLKKIDVGHVEAYVGHSNGGAMAIRGLSNGTLQSDKLVLLASAGIRGTQKRRNAALRVVTKTGKLLAKPLPAQLQRRLRSKLYASVGSDMLVAEDLQETFKRVVADDVRQDAAKLTLPALLVYGEQDSDTPVWYGEQFHELIAGSVLEILPNAGHFVHLDRAADVERAIKEFLS